MKLEMNLKKFGLLVLTVTVPRPHQGHHPRPRDNDAFLVRQGDLLPRTQGGLQSRYRHGPGRGEDHMVHRRVFCKSGQPFGAAERFLVRLGRVVDAERRTPELRRQRRQLFGGRPRGEGADLERLGMSAADVQNGRPDAARRSTTQIGRASCRERV